MCCENSVQIGSGMSFNRFSSSGAKRRLNLIRESFLRIRDITEAWRHRGADYKLPKRMLQNGRGYVLGRPFQLLDGPRR